MFLGTIVNAAAVVAGGLLGLLFKKGMKPSLEESIHKALGVAVLVLGLNGIISSMFTVSAEGKPSSSGELLLIVSLVLGMLEMCIRDSCWPGYWAPMPRWWSTTCSGRRFSSSKTGSSPGARPAPPTMGTPSACWRRARTKTAA